MIKHMIMWQFKDSLSADEKQTAINKLVQDIAAVQKISEGITEYHLQPSTEMSSNYDLLLLVGFDTQEHFDAFQHDPFHLQVAQYLASVMQSKACQDYDDDAVTEHGEAPMIRHIVMWRFDDRLSVPERQTAAIRLKHDIEGLKEQIPGVHKLTVNIEPLASSNRDILLDSIFDSAKALAAYQIDPRHVAVGQYLSAVAGERACIDFKL